MILSPKQLKNAEKAAQALEQLKATRWSSFVNGYFSARGFTNTVLTVLVNALLLQFVMPIVPGIAFTGGFAQAIESALVLLVMTAITGIGFTSYFQWALGFAVRGQAGKSGALIMALLFIGGPILESIKFKVLTLVPGNLALNGFGAYVWAILISIVAITLLTSGFNRVWPAKKTATALSNTDGQEEQD